MSENKLDMIDDFLSGKLNSSDQSSFEDSLKNDTSLQDEVSLQKDIINSIKDVRKSELKARLNSLPTPTGLTNLQKFGVAAVTLSAGALLTLGLIQTTDNSLTTTSTEIEVVKETPAPIIQKVEVTTPSQKQNTEINAEKKQPIAAEKETLETTTSSTEETIVSPDLPSPSPGMYNIEDSEGVHHNTNVSPNNDLSNRVKESTSNYKTTVEHSSKKFMYKYDGEHLTLIGDFSAKPYTVLETAKNGNKKLYLKYDNKFYGISESKKAVNFNEIKNTELIIELKKK